MRNQRSMLLAGAAVLALVAATSLASAQEQSKDGGAQAKEPQTSTQPMKAEPGAAGGQAQVDGKIGQSTPGQQNTPSEKMGQSAQNPNTQPGNENARRDKMGKMQGARSGAEQNAKGTERIGPSTAQQGTKERGQRAEEINRDNKTDKGSAATSTAQDQRLKGLQGNASGANLTQEQRTHIRDTVIGARHAPRVGRVDFNVAVGTVIPRGRIHRVRVPETLVQIEPEWRGFLYFVYEDEVVIVNPRDMRIVAVLAV
jgi:hypothetical protein